LDLLVASILLANFVNGLLKYLNFLGDMWIPNNYLNVMLLKYDGKTLMLNIYKYMLNSENNIKATDIILPWSTLHILLKGLSIQSYCRILWWNSTCYNYGSGLSPIPLIYHMIALMSWLWVLNQIGNQGHVLGPFLAIEFSICAKKKIKR